MATYPATKVDSSVGTVNGQTFTQYVYDVNINPLTEYDAIADEYIIRVNGRVIRRMSKYQAQRMGLIDS